MIQVGEHPLLVIAGPTASGKTSLALQLAEQLAAEGRQAEILCADSITVYRGFEIGAAKPTEAERAAVPHHFVDIADAEEDYTAGAFVRTAHPLIQRLHRERKVPIVVGGTGFYLRALLWGMASDEEQAAPEAARLKLELEERGRTEGWDKLYRQLAKRDPGAIQVVHANDHYRIVRALQALALYGKPWSELNREARQAPPRYPEMRYFCLRWPMEELESRIKQRVEKMLREGLLEEVRGLLARGISSESKPMRSVGYKEAVEALREGWSESKTADAITLATRRLAKQQLTWFRGERAVEWLDPDFAANLSRALENTK